jgi:hypothetical protein
MVDLFKTMSYDKDDKRWKENRSFFASFKIQAEFEFGKDTIGVDHPIIDTITSLTGMKNAMENYKKAKKQ